MTNASAITALKRTANTRSANSSKTVQILENLSLPAGEKVLFVKPEDVADKDFWCASSIERELEFLQSHTIHHYALIGFKLRAFGFDLPVEFGVAPSTLRFWNRQKIGGGLKVLANGDVYFEEKFYDDYQLDLPDYSGVDTAANLVFQVHGRGRIEVYFYDVDGRAKRMDRAHRFRA